MEQGEIFLKRLKDNDGTVIKEIFHAYYPMVCSTVFQYVKEKNIAKDIGQNVMVKFWERRDQLNIKSSLPAYLHRMGMNAAISHLRSNRKFVEEDNIPPTLSSFNEGIKNLEGAELKTSVDQAIDLLPLKCKTIFKLSRYEGLSHKEIATKLDLAEKTVENQVGIALKQLRKSLGHLLNMLIICILHYINHYF